MQQKLTKILYLNSKFYGNFYKFSYYFFIIPNIIIIYIKPFIVLNSLLIKNQNILYFL